MKADPKIFSNTMASSQSTSKLLTTALAVVAGYNEWNMEAILAPRAENCIQRVYPDRLGRASYNNTEYNEYFSKFLPYFKNFNVTIIDTFVDESANRVAIQAKSSADSVVGHYGNEYVLMLKMTESQDKIYEFREFVDSEYSASFFPRLSAYIAEGGQGYPQ
ncbi:hypothetical protein HBI56_070200 [Parastagonospora nodorum]|uniref:SnoaL-like domain-containing protein n=2 Tax=Phaeosphaeria nodorum (strain SN15 / ATCC MYA-4574 / FGSC 10173) TaxID=321614 RepID=A0A7U2ENZ7_PHANO|nr:hypothetical protein SNOG_09757 [Parastagonospora nodorum SN15]KAH3920447.1 hypothetical protein HBH56_004640 [Parastagonospora nodorum]EAT83022.2 hypothetical protein SNOG_09757 [Parastagonospora nodorum SN15]KAH3937855.1 hypothetical protein HBH54_004630 [Parastagonospora nodorum]KAH3946542.1 hypothetical protein HBH53_127340 [Parastagonospora nodorum]KAH3975111.1 hypothetical protein HBH51_087380 [Parastagonospora nodorum]